MFFHLLQLFFEYLYGMTGKTALALLVHSLIFSVVYAQSSRYAPAHSTILNTAQGEKCLKQCSRSTPNVDGFFKVSSHDSILLVQNFKKIKKKKAQACCFVYTGVKSLDQYYYQYAGVVIKHKKYIYINAFVAGPYELSKFLKNWRKEPAIICGGGTGFWGILFDIADESFSQLAFNGAK